MPAPAIVIVHGLWMPAGSTALLGRRLRTLGFAPYRFAYPSVSGDFLECAQALAAFERNIAADTVHFLGHSLGGALILAMLESYQPSRPGRIVCLGSPLLGSRAALGLLKRPGGRRLLGCCMQGLLERGPFPPWRGPRELGIIAGRRPFGLGRLLAQFDGPNDGTVAVAETRLAGATDHVVLLVTHLLMLCSAEVARQAALFLRDGRFDHEPRAAATSS